MEKKYKKFSEFYPFYLSEHSNISCRRLHFIGTSLLFIILIFTFVTHKWILLVLLPLVCYGFAWIGHFVFEKNKPATFQYPVLSLMGDFAMFKDILSGKIKF